MRKKIKNKKAYGEGIVMNLRDDSILAQSTDVV